MSNVVVGYVRIVGPTSWTLTTRDGEEVTCSTGPHMGWDVLVYCRDRFAHKYVSLCLDTRVLTPLDPDTGRPGTPYCLLTHTHLVRVHPRDRPGR
jgi:hypothetical protein